MTSRVDPPLVKSVEAIRTLFRQPEKLSTTEMLALLPADHPVCERLRGIVSEQAASAAEQVSASRDGIGDGGGSGQ